MIPWGGVQTAVLPLGAPHDSTPTGQEGSYCAGWRTPDDRGEAGQLRTVEVRKSCLSHGRSLRASPGVTRPGIKVPGAIRGPSPSRTSKDPDLSGMKVWLIPPH